MRAVKQAAAAAGFDLCGIAAAVPGEEDARLQEWLARGYHGDMKYMERRKDVRELLPGCKSVIALGVNYYVHAGHDSDPAKPRVSRYAWGEDYHRVLGRMLHDLEARLGEAFPGESFLACCDTKPVLEKAWAERAGIGWVGKNGCLISQQYGSWVFLAVLLTTAALEADAPHPDRCGTCERCLHSCPTDAFVAPKVIDARKCIPYLTIEQWKPIPKDLKTAPWAFGCDVCQDVCPWNRKAKDSGRKEFAPRPGQDHPDLAQWVRMKGPEYRETYGDTALSRPGRRGLARNALAVLREQGLDDETRKLALKDASALVRKQAQL
ncbi:MAG: tRNA epoxyqueuosine(34) reductase QueG [Planctomycetota bacterium]|nr:tRNA epoxyqueuosine(34) reductase QueG [Planctomycetota bacterium]